MVQRYNSNLHVKDKNIYTDKYLLKSELELMLETPLMYKISHTTLSKVLVFVTSSSVIFPV